jgi:hypothetical protein
VRIIVGKPPANEQFRPAEEGWIPLKEPKNMFWFQLLAFPISICLVILITSLATALNIATTIVLDLYSLLDLLLALGLVIVVHEFLHGIMFPGRLFSENVMFGVWPKALAFYAHYDGELTRNRFLIVLITPFLAISVLPLFILKLLGVSNSFVIVCCLINAFISCGDVLGVLLILFQVPRKAKMRNQQFKSYWKYDTRT